MVYEPAYYKYVPHVDQEGFGVHAFPEAIGVLFKIIVFMLLFKFIIAMVMDSYKENHKKKRLKSTMAWNEIGSLLRYMCEAALSKWPFNRPYVCMRDLAIALKDRSSTTENSGVKEPNIVDSEQDMLRLLQTAFKNGSGLESQKGVSWLGRRPHPPQEYTLE